jgi:hypothetical protein
MKRPTPVIPNLFRDKRSTDGAPDVLCRAKFGMTEKVDA